MTNLVLIPARMASTRLPGKPLADIAGKPMILHVAERARAADIGRVVVATDSPEIRRVVEAAGFEAVMTGGHHPSGSDRIFEALTLLDPVGAVEFVINLQGDLPTIEPETIRQILRPLADPACDIATLAAPAGEAERTDPSVVKLVGSPSGGDLVRALYFTRATAPSGEGPLLHHIGIYAYRRRALERFVSLGPSTLEVRESLEQLRALEAGMRIDAAIVDAVPFGVDTAAQLEEARRRFASAGGATNRIAFQGEPGANSDTACRDRYPDMQPLPCPTFEDAFAAVTKGEADLAMIPIENTIAGRVADIHHLLPDSGLKIVGEYFLPIRFQLMAKRGTALDEIREVHSHIHALGQCRGILRRNGWKPVVSGDTAGAARIVSEMADRGAAALAPRLAAELYGLDILAEDVEDAEHNTTRFVVLSRAGQAPRSLHAPSGNGPTLTTFVFEVRNLPAALYKAMGGFATNGVNMTKLESYQLGGQFTATQFYADIEGHPDDVGVANALEELAFFTKRLTILGVYPAAANRS